MTLLRLLIAPCLLIYQSIFLALGQIWANKVRSLLTTIGIIIGVASVTAVVAALTGLKQNVLSEFETFGTNKIYILPYAPDTSNGMYENMDLRFHPSDFDSLLEHCPSVARFTRQYSFNRNISYGPHTLKLIAITGIEPDWHLVENRSVIIGRPFSLIDNTQCRPVCLVNEKAQQSLGLDSDPSGQAIMIGDRRYVVVGVVESKPESAMFGRQGGNRQVFIPFNTAYSQAQDMIVIAASRSPSVSQEARAEVRFYLRNKRRIPVGKPDNFSMEVVQRFVDDFIGLAAAVTTVAGGIVGISLLVGGVGIMNIMLVSVSERTREIGLRKAVGARPAAILLQFLVEALVLCLMGGLVGLLAGEGITAILKSIPAAKLDKAVVPGWAVALSFGFAAAVGLIFGMFPAIKAARLDPIEALRMNKLSASAIALAVAACVFPAGCVNRFGTGGTGEVVIPAHELHEAEGSNLQRYVQPRPAQTQPITGLSAPGPMLFLTIEECRLAALANNLDLKVELYNPTIAHAAVTQEQAAFEATFNAAAAYAQNHFPAAGGVPAYTQYNLAPDVNLQLPLETGGLIKLDAPYQYSQGTYIQTALNSYYAFSPAFTFSQPLLRGFGFDVNAQSIRVAYYHEQQTQARAKLEVIRVLAECDRAYWHLYASRALLDVRRKQYDLAVVQLERARRQAKAGMMAEVDIVRAESGVADQVEQIIIAENDARQKDRDLKRILNRPDLGMETSQQLIPATAPNSTEFHLDPDRLAAAAMMQRMELLDIELQIIADTATVRFARNQLLPMLSVQYTYSHNGYSSSVGETFAQAWNRDNEGHTVGLNLSFPIGNEAAKSQLRQAMLNRLQQLATKEQRAQQIVKEVFDATDNLNTDFQRIAAAHKRVVLAQRVLGVEVRQFNQGLRTSTEVLDAQAKLADAQSSEIAAITDYQVVQVDIAVATGTVLGASRVHWEAAGRDVVRSVR